MIRTFEKKTGNTWNEVVITNTETNGFEQFCYEIVNGKLVKFSESKTTNDSKMWLKERCKQLRYNEVNNDFLDNYPIWSKEDQENYTNTIKKGDSEMVHTTITEIKSNGSKWYGQQPDGIDTLIEVLNTYSLDPTFEDYGNFISEYKTQRITEENKHLIGCTSFFGNFHTYSNVFNIVTNDDEVINKLSKSIRQNQQREDYKEAKIEYQAQNKLDEIAQDKFNKREIGLKEMYEMKNANGSSKQLFEDIKKELSA